MGVKVETVAKAMNITPRRVQQLVKDGMPKGTRGQYDLGACLIWYVRYLQAALESRVDPEQRDLNEQLTIQRTRHAKAQADKTELESDVLRQTLIPREEVVDWYSGFVSATRAKMRSIPTKAAAVVIAMSEPEAEFVLMQYIDDALNELSDANTASTPRPAKADSKPVGRQISAAQPGGKRRAGTVEH